jgi:hypothetical protein
LIDSNAKTVKAKNFCLKFEHNMSQIFRDAISLFFQTAILNSFIFLYINCWRGNDATYRPLGLELRTGYLYRLLLAGWRHSRNEENRPTAATATLMPYQPTAAKINVPKSYCAGQMFSEVGCPSGLS